MTHKHFDDILTAIGTGKWNIFIIIGYCFCSFMVPSNVFAGSFLTPHVDFVCQVTEDQEFEILDQCQYAVKDKELNGSLIKSCTNWTFEQDIFPTSLTETFGLVCDRNYLRPTFQTVYMMGTFLTAPINGFLSDKLGRKIMFSSGVILSISCNLISSWMSNFQVLLVLRFLLGIAHPSIVQTGFILCMEVCEKKYRTIVGLLICVPWAFGTIFWGVIGYFIDDWHWLYRVSCVSGVVFITCFMWSIDESPRWLIVVGQHAKALKVLRKAAKWNNVDLSPDEEVIETMKLIQESSISKVVQNSDEGTVSGKKSRSRNFQKLLQHIWILYKTPELRRITLIIYVLFIVGSTVYYGLSLNAVNFQLNPYVYMMVGGLMEIPAYTLTIPIVTRLGRVIPTIISFLVCGVTIMALAFTPSEHSWFIITLVMIGKLCIASAYQIIYIIASEVFPTEIRLQGLGTSNFVSRIGSISAPYITDGLGPLYPWVPSVFFGTLSLIAGVVAWFVPETLNKPLPETITELEEEAKERREKKLEIQI